MNKPIFLLLTIVLILQACKGDPPLPECPDVDYTNIKLEGTRPDLNISILLDLSDRIDPVKYPNSAMEFYLRDLGHIKSVAEAFEIHLRNKTIKTINDNLQLFLDPAPSDPTLDDKVKKLKISFNKYNAKKCSILETSRNYDSISRMIYERAIEDNKYVGSDTWRFFKNKVKDYCIRDGYRNILVVLTDGYIYHRDNIIKENNRTTYLTPQEIRTFRLNNSDWLKRITDNKFGFIQANSDLTNLEVLVLGINPQKGNPYEEDVVIKYWTDWLENMNVKKFEIKQSDLPSNMDKLIKDFIFNE